MRHTFIKIEDYCNTRESLREFMKGTKKLNNIAEKYARIRFIKELKLEIDSFLKARGMLRKFK